MEKNSPTIRALMATAADEESQRSMCLRLAAISPEPMRAAMMARASYHANMASYARIRAARFTVN